MRHAAIMFVIAWVLWSEAVPRSAQNPKPTWTPVDSFQTQPPCQSAARERESRERNNLVEQITFKCFPDNVDPRPRQ
jgi:hypothetical protein